MTTTNPTGRDHHIVISADTHCGADLWGYKSYLEARYHDTFDEWARHIEAEQAKQEALFVGAGHNRSTRNVGVGGDPVLDADRNFSSERRLREETADGVIASVLFPNTQPPFAPSPATQFEAPPYSDDFEMRWAGLRAHNRWLVDFVSLAPERRAGIAQIFLGDVDGSVAEIEWAAEHGLRGGILIPGAPPGSPFEPLYSPSYEPIWAAAQRCSMPLNHHAGGATPDFGPYFPTSLAMFMLEVQWWTQRALWHLMFAGIFERYPDIRFVTTETGTAWVPETLARLDSFYHRMKYSEFGSESVFGGMAVAGMSLKPSEYWERQCYIGASFLRPTEARSVREIGVHKIMWGSDYPHLEGSYPFTKEHLRLTFSNLTVDETTQILTSNAVDVYKFDIAKLTALAVAHCPTKAQVATPIDYAEIPDAAKGCPGLNPLNQLNQLDQLTGAA